uniref:Uncharacterized protein n=1 Tax=Onchocerca volvulus TaxID=6282 RepID=A0A8R1TRB5_ONCVO
MKAPQFTELKGISFLTESHLLLEQDLTSILHRFQKHPIIRKLAVVTNNPFIAEYLWLHSN